MIYEATTRNCKANTKAKPKLTSARSSCLSNRRIPNFSLVGDGIETVGQRKMAWSMANSQKPFSGSRRTHISPIQNQCFTDCASPIRSPGGKDKPACERPSATSTLYSNHSLEVEGSGWYPFIDSTSQRHADEVGVGRWRWMLAETKPPFPITTIISLWSLVKTITGSLLNSSTTPLPFWNFNRVAHISSDVQ